MGLVSDIVSLYAQAFRVLKKHWVKVLAFLLIVAGIGFVAVPKFLKSSEVYIFAVTKAKENALVRDYLGEPIAEGFMPLGKVSALSGFREAQLTITLKGTLSDGTLYVRAYKEAGRWHYQELVFVKGKFGESLSLLDAH